MKDPREPEQDRILSMTSLKRLKHLAKSEIKEWERFLKKVEYEIKKRKK